MAGHFHCELSRHAVALKGLCGTPLHSVSSLDLAAVPVTRLTVVQQQRTDVTRSFGATWSSKAPKQRRLSDPVGHVWGTKYRPRQFDVPDSIA
jgi:hypothetical protein